MSLEIYTDGGCNPNPGVGGWGFAAYKDGETVKEEYGGELNTTNNRMEMTAIINALEYANGAPCKIYSDSQLCVNTLNTWAIKWKQKGWSKKGGEIKNLDLVKTAYALKQANNDAKILWVKGHCGIPGNERADALAGIFISLLQQHKNEEVQPAHVSDSGNVEPFGYFRAESFGWTDCAETDEGATPLYDKSVIDGLIVQRDQFERIANTQHKLVHSLEKRHDELLSALIDIRSTNASKHGTQGMMIRRCIEIASDAIASVKGGAA